MLAQLEIPDDVYNRALEVAQRTFPGDPQALGKALAASMVRFTTDSEIDLQPTQGQALKISGIPAWAIEQFKSRAEGFYPSKEQEHPGWKRFLMDTILSLCDVDQRVFQITGIEADVMYRADVLVKQMGYVDFHEFVGRLLLDTKNDNFYGARMHSDAGIQNTFTVMISNIPVQAAAVLRAVAEQMNVGLPEPLRFGLKTPVELLVFMLAQAVDNGPTFFGEVKKLADTKDFEDELRAAVNDRAGNRASTSGTK